MPADISQFLLPLDMPDIQDDGRKFNFHMDDYFMMGASHHVCEDYTRTTQKYNGKFVTDPFKKCVVVSDGCSSAADSDFGSRFMAMAAIRARCCFPVNDTTPEMLIWLAGYYLASPLEEGCLDATVMMAYPLESGYVKVQVFGDGVVSVRRRDGSVETYAIDQGGAPSYPSYFTNAGRMKALKEAGYGGRKVTVTVDGEQKAIWEWTPDELEAYPDFTFLVDPRDTEVVVLMSDGVESFQDISNLSPVPVPLAEVLPHIVEFKNLGGAFIGRRLTAFEKKTCPKKKWQHYDDLGVGGLYIEEVIEEKEEPK